MPHPIVGCASLSLSPLSHAWSCVHHAEARLTRAYDLRSVPVEIVKELHDNDGRVHYLQEPLVRVRCANLAEKRPSVQQADRVFAWRADGGDGSFQAEYEGFVHRVEVRPHASEEGGGLRMAEDGDAEEGGC
jgi:hypothetical protein